VYLNCAQLWARSSRLVSVTMILAREVGVLVRGRTSAARGFAQKFETAMFHPIGHVPFDWSSRTVEGMTTFHKTPASRTDECAELLSQIANGLALDDNEMADLFGVDGEEMQRWMTQRVPPTRLSQLADVWMVVVDLTSRLDAGELAGLARKPALAFSNQTLLEALAHDPSWTRNKVERFVEQLERESRPAEF